MQLISITGGGGFVLMLAFLFPIKMFFKVKMTTIRVIFDDAMSFASYKIECCDKQRVVHPITVILVGK